MARKKNIDIDLAKYLYLKKNWPTSKIAKKMGVHLQTIINRFRDNGVKIKKQGNYKLDIDDRKIAKYYNSGMTVKQTAEKFNISEASVRKILHRNNIVIKREGGSHRRIDLPKEQLINMYIKGEKSIKNCAKHFGVSESVVTRILRENNIKIRKNRPRHDDRVTSKIIELYWGQKLSISQTAKSLGKSDSFIRRKLNECGKGTRSISDGARIIRDSDHIKDEELIYMYDQCCMSCEQISKKIGKSSQFVRQRFIAIGKDRRKNFGKYNGAWKGGITDLRNAIRTSAKYSEWRSLAFDKYNYSSEISGENGELNCHHIHPFRVLLQSSTRKHKPLPEEYRNLAIINDKRFYDLSNAMVIAEKEHNLIENKKLEFAHPFWSIWKHFPEFALSRFSLNTRDYLLFNDNGQISCDEFDVDKIDYKTAKNIVKYEHYSGTMPSSKLILGAKRGNVLLGIASFGISANKNIPQDIWELTRLCIPYYVVRPFGSVFLGSCCDFIKTYYPNVKKLIAFADPSVGHDGGIYRMSGWGKAGKTQSSYAYFDPYSMELRHKSVCRRVKGISKTEKQLADDKGLIKIPLLPKYRYTKNLM